jgi:hypothetical protein
MRLEGGFTECLIARTFNADESVWVTSQRGELRGSVRSLVCVRVRVGCVGRVKQKKKFKNNKSSVVVREELTWGGVIRGERQIYRGAESSATSLRQNQTLTCSFTVLTLRCLTSLRQKDTTYAKLVTWYGRSVATTETSTHNGKSVRKSEGKGKELREREICQETKSSATSLRQNQTLTAPSRF